MFDRDGERVHDGVDGFILLRPCYGSCSLRKTDALVRELCDDERCQQRDGFVTPSKGESSRE